jgi:hypothetical protein
MTTRPVEGSSVPEALGSPKQVAAFLGVAPGTLALWRGNGRGPVWTKVGRLVRYDWAQVRQWVAGGGDRS